MHELFQRSLHSPLLLVLSQSRSRSSHHTPSSATIMINTLRTVTVTVRRRSSEPHQQTTVKSATNSCMNTCSHRMRIIFERFILTTALLLQLRIHTILAEKSYDPIIPSGSYDLITRPFINTNSTIPPEYNQQNTTSQAVFEPGFLRQYWCDDVAWAENGCFDATWSWSQLPQLGEFQWYSTVDVLISPTGLIGLGGSSSNYGAPFIPPFMSIAQPDQRIETNFQGGTLITFYNSQILWNVKELNYSILSPYNTSSTDALLRIYGSLVSFANATHPNSSTALEFEVQLDSATGIIVMHIISLENATAADLYSPISIGVITFGGGIETDVTMFLNNEFVTNRTISRTLVWTPYFRQNEGCMSAYDCSTCIQKQGCYFCESTSSCVDIYPNPTNTTIPISAHCPEGIVLKTCPPALIYSCLDCVQSNGRWCTGQADCFRSGIWMNGTTTDCNSDNAYVNLRTGSWVPYCVGANETCGQQTCNQLYQSQHSECTVMSQGNLAPVACQCQLGYDNSNDPQCTICSSGYYQDTDGVTCRKCPTVSPTLIAIFLTVGVVVTFILIKLNSHPLFRRLLVPIQNSIVYFQVVSLLELIDFHWPLGVRKTITAISIMGLNLFHLPELDIECFLTTSQALTFTLLAPVLIIVLLFLSGIIGSIYVNRRSRSAEESIRSSDQLSSVLLRAFLTFLILFYNHLVWQLMDAYTNDSIDWSHTSSSVVEAAKVIGGTLLYLIGIPLFFWFLIFPRHQPTRCCCCVHPVGRSDILIPLISKYRPGICQYWECTFVPLWKILFNAIVVFGSGRNQQIALLSSLLILMIFSYTLIAPYTSVLNNREQSWLMGGSLLILLSGLCFYESEPGDTTGKLVLLCLSYFLIIGTMVLMVILMVYVMFVIYRDYAKEQSKSLSREVGGAREEQEEDEGAAGEVDQGGGVDMISSDDDDTSSTIYLSLSTSAPLNDALISHTSSPRTAAGSSR